MISAAKVRDFSQSKQVQADLLIAVLGYERRSASLIRYDQIGDVRRIIALNIGHDKVLSYKENAGLFRDARADIVPAKDTPIEQLIENAMQEMHQELGRLSVAVDISSMDRTSMGEVLYTIVKNSSLVEKLSVIYIPARYSDPDLTFPNIERIGPVIPEFSGFQADPTLPVCLIMGLGYEYGISVGILNHLEPRVTVCLRGIGTDTRFETAVREANLQFDFGIGDVRMADYPVLDPKITAHKIDAFVSALVREYRLIFVPIGPKILSSVLMLAAATHYGRIAVWRVARRLRPAEAEPADSYVDATVDLASVAAGWRAGIQSLARISHQPSR